MLQKYGVKNEYNIYIVNVQFFCIYLTLNESNV